MKLEIGEEKSLVTDKNTANSDVWGQGNKYIVVRHGSKYDKIYLKDIVYVETFERKIIIHTVDKETEYYGKMLDLESALGCGFYRTHRAYLVNLEHVKSFDIDTVHTIKGEVIMSKAKYQGFVELIKSVAEISV